MKNKLSPCDIKEMEIYVYQIKQLTDEQLILFDLIINIYPLKDIEENLEREKIPFDFSYYDYDNVNKVKKLVKVHLALRHIDIL